MAYLKADRNSSTVAAGGHGDHVPVSVELGRNCSGSETENYESGGESEDACTIANYGDPRSKVRTISEAPATGDRGFRVPLGGTWDGEGNPSLFLLYTRSVTTV